MLRAVTLLCLLLAVPVLGVLGSWLVFDAESLATLQHQWQTVLPEYLWHSGLLALGVAIGVALLGGATAAAVTLFDFPLRRVFEWALLLPLAMPAYVLAYAYTDFLQFSGPLQMALRELTGAQGALWPDVRSLPGAVALFILCLYPYVYLLTRAALGERAVPLMEAARLLGAGSARRVREVALPLARPALAAGVALALMETLADYGVVSYFGLTTVTTGIYHAWLGMNDSIAASQLASVLLAGVALLMWLERRAQRRLRFATGGRGAAHGAEARPIELQGASAAFAFALCLLPVLLGFALPVAVLLRLVVIEAHDAGALDAAAWSRFADWGWTSLRLALMAAALAVALSLTLAFAARTRRGGLLNFATRVVALGYAVPGAVIAVGILLPVGWLQAVAPGAGTTALVTGTAFGLMYAYLVRFSAVALQSVEAGYARVPLSVDESARLLGVPQRRMFFELHVPLLRRSALAAALLVFVDVMKELPATLLLRPFDSDTLAVVAYQLARDERLGEAALPSIAIVAVGLIPVLLLSRAMRERAPRA
ncbi:MAG: iron ABC transporter permease [Rhizobacter sp.]|nr:iron ABC transporter permease [Rhizobacter sp.]